MDLIRHLRFFVSVADEGHFGRAAAALEMTQPPLSQGLRRLEQHLGVDLLHRTRQGAVLTAAGLQLLPRARLLVDDADRLLAESQRIAQAHGAVHWGATSALPDAMITAGVRALRTAVVADAAVSTTVAPTVDLVGAVRAGLCDVAVIEHPALVDGVEARPVVKLPRWLVVPSEHRSAGAERPTFPMLAGLSFACSPRSGNPPAYDTTLDLLRERGLDAPTVPAPDDRAVFAAVAAGTSFGLTTTAPASTPGVAWLRLAPQAVALRIRVVHRPEAAALADAVDRVLYRERL
ncbi:LysR family transcriptional regulator [Nocardia otitidiscaviarum]|uniref:LysR family transcriptional regulator n=1 Tax=Nocardia otitidiscaviarum TaxID=1823 RepID=UPI0004A6DE19|nr:LysR family transcriptional regulator [Nocardia otitidiscaviarum]MBF6136309.1 LysR family transcriptional regulator [Nocardia otitidiscaviarum]MBF6484511.1 LysR family transcriptional regulator [Nocardia otitidiscaviarum]